MSAERPQYDVAVVGAGPAGSSAALTLARKGVKVLLLDRSRVPGEANVSGGVLYGDFTKGYGLIDLIPGFESEAPLERKVLSHEVNILSAPDVTDGTYRRYRLHGNSVLARLGLSTVEIQTGHDYTVVRGDFDRWFAEKATAAGAELRTATAVAGLLTKSEATSSGDEGLDKAEPEVVGVSTTKGEEIRASLVIDCGGVTSTLVEDAGLRGPLGPRQLYHAIKHVYRIPEEEMDRRFKLRRGEGRAINCFGDFMQGVSGSAFLFTNRETLSVGVVASVDSMVRAFTERFDSVGSLHDVLATFESHPFIAELLERAQPLESLAHNIPKGHLAMLKRPYATGYLPTGDALGAFIKIGPLFDGMRRAIASGIMAAQTYLLANETGSFRASNLSRYKEMLAPLYEDSNRAGRESFFSESGFAYSALPRVLFSSLLFAKKVKFGTSSTGSGHGIPAGYPAEGPSAKIDVTLDAASRSSTKPWVPTCPAGCFSLVTSKGRFTSYRDLYAANLKAVGASPENQSGLDVLAYRETTRDIQEGGLEFDVSNCVGCGTCAEIGPKELVSFEPGEPGKGVRYQFG